MLFCSGASSMACDQVYAVAPLVHGGSLHALVKAEIEVLCLDCSDNFGGDPISVSSSQTAHGASSVTKPSGSPTNRKPAKNTVWRPIHEFAAIRALRA
jgi:hypothetical protein